MSVCARLEGDGEGEGGNSPENADKSPINRSSLPELAEPSPDDYVLMKEETFNLDPAKDVG